MMSSQPQFLTTLKTLGRGTCTDSMFRRIAFTILLTFLFQNESSDAFTPPVFRVMPSATFERRHCAIVTCSMSAPGPCSSSLEASAAREEDSPRTRRSFLRRTCTSATASALLILTPSSRAVAGGSSDESFERTTKDFSYSLTPPHGFEQTKKPLKTHLDEVNFVSSKVGSYQFGITVDPVRIQSLKDFGTPEQVAARVVTAEVNRDGVFDVTLLKDPVVSSDGAYQLEYLSRGKRGDKHFVAKFYIINFKLYVLTAQVKQEFFDQYQAELVRCVESFRLL